jgi:hypothetical protein
MTLHCKHCGTPISLTERESSQIAADLDRRMSFDQQAELKFVAVCGECWEEENERRRTEADNRPVRIQLVRATA